MVTTVSKSVVLKIRRILSLIKSLTRNEAHEKSDSRSDEITNDAKQTTTDTAQKCYMNVSGPVWEQEARGSSPRTPTNFCRKTA